MARSWPATATRGGSFVVGFSAAEIAKLPKYEQQYFSNTKNERALTIPAFDLARYPVTNAQYALFMKAAGYDPSKPWWDDASRAWLARDDAATKGLEAWQRRDFKDRPEFWDDPTFGIAHPNHPVVGVNWYEAMAFCRWLSETPEYNPEGFTYALPSEAEWECAARGLQRRMYPWGNDELDSERGSYGQTYGVTTLAVGCFPRGATPEGVLDLAGNVWEWTRSAYQPYPYDPADGRERGSDPAGKRFTLRGGSWFDRTIVLRGSSRGRNSPDNHNQNVGFRLLRRPPSAKN
ncbi:formylglycine-generating enzyme family protein [Chloroflexales bacterium ZM16-3]|nr:formylglycine-generating enzyme family protein [Chloroflexales bacterium ZM16-3]